MPFPGHFGAIGFLNQGLQFLQRLALQKREQEFQREMAQPQMDILRLEAEMLRRQNILSQQMFDELARTSDPSEQLKIIATYTANPDVVKTLFREQKEQDRVSKAIEIIKNKPEQARIAQILTGLNIPQTPEEQVAVQKKLMNVFMDPEFQKAFTTQATLRAESIGMLKRAEGLAPRIDQIHYRLYTEDSIERYSKTGDESVLELDPIKVIMLMPRSNVKDATKIYVPSSDEMNRLYKSISGNFLGNGHFVDSVLKNESVFSDRSFVPRRGLFFGIASDKIEEKVDKVEAAIRTIAKGNLDMAAMKSLGASLTDEEKIDIARLAVLESLADFRRFKGMNPDSDVTFKYWFENVYLNGKKINQALFGGKGLPDNVYNSTGVAGLGQEDASQVPQQAPQQQVQQKQQGTAKTPQNAPEAQKAQGGIQDIEQGEKVAPGASQDVLGAIEIDPQRAKQIAEELKRGEVKEFLNRFAELASVRGYAFDDIMRFFNPDAKLSDKELQDYREIVSQISTETGGVLLDIIKEFDRVRRAAEEE